METVKKLEQSGKHEKYEFEYREVMSNQIVFPEYQRRPRALKLAMIEGDFDENIANEPKVSFRDGKYYSLDGQHTVLARVSRNGGKPLKILCKVYYGMSPEKEAYYFEQQTGYSTKLNNPEKQRARLFRGDDVVAKIKSIAELYGFQYDFRMSGGQNCIVCYAAAERCFTKYGEEAFTMTLSTLRAAWDGDPVSLRKEIILGLGCFYSKYAHRMDDKAFRKKLKAVTPGEILRGGKNDVDNRGDAKFAKQFLKIYNIKRKDDTRLEW